MVGLVPTVWILYMIEKDALISMSIFAMGDLLLRILAPGSKGMDVVWRGC